MVLKINKNFTTPTFFIIIRTLCIFYKYRIIDTRSLAINTSILFGWCICNYTIISNFIAFIKVRRRR